MAKTCKMCHSVYDDDEVIFCKYCGTKVTAEPSPSTNSSTQVKDEGQIPPKKGSELQGKIVTGCYYYILISGIVVVLCIAIAAVGYTFSNNSPSNSANPQIIASPSPLNDPNAFRTALPTTPTPIPTPTLKKSPRFVKGDIVTWEPVTSETKSLYIVLSYSEPMDSYTVTFIHRNDDGSWGYWTVTSIDYYFPRENFENENGVELWVYGHINPDQVPCEEFKDPDAAKFFACPR